MQLIAITNQPSLAAAYQRLGVDRIMVDLETIGKVERQAGRSTWISDHTFEDVSRAREVLRAGSLMVRVNPVHPGSGEEIGEVCRRGADIVMLPMARTADEVRRFVDAVGGRARTCLLVETAEALRAMDAILSVQRLDEVHFGLNDLHVTLGMRCMFEVLSEGLLDDAADSLKSRGKPFGIGGIAALGGGPIDPRLILVEHVRLGSSMVILSRSFFAGVDRSSPSDGLAVVAQRVNELRAYLEAVRRLPHETIGGNRDALRVNVAQYLNAGKSDGNDDQ
jgi:hypothetical protein